MQLASFVDKYIILFASVGQEWISMQFVIVIDLYVKFIPALNMPY